MNKLRLNKLSASVMRATSMLLMLLGAVSASANDGDKWNAKNAIVSPDDEWYCRVEVVSEADATVKIINREDEGEGHVNTLASAANQLTSFWIRNEVEHNGKTYRIVGIGNKAFTGMSSLREVTYMGDYIEFIEDDAFWDCPLLESVHLPEGVKTIGKWAFMDCYSLRCTNKNGQRDDNLVLPSKLERIEMMAFRSCSSLERVVFPDSLHYIARWGFADCTKLSDVTLPNEADVEGGVFVRCNNVINIAVKRVSYEGKLFDYEGILYRRLDNGKSELAAFPGGRNGDVTIPDITYSIGTYAFDAASITSVRIPSTVKNFGRYAFCENSALTKVFVEWIKPEDLPTYDLGVFYDALSGIARTLYIPYVGTGVNAEQIRQAYTNSKWNDWFSTITTYDVGNVEGLLFAGWYVRRTEVYDITCPELTQGKASYDLETQTLNLSNVYLDVEDNSCGLNNDGIMDLNIKLEGNNTIHTFNTGIFSSYTTRLLGPGSLEIVSENAEAMYVKVWKYFIYDCSLKLRGREGGIVGNGEATLTFRNAYVDIEPGGAWGVETIKGFKWFYLDSCFISYPMFGGYDDVRKTIVDRVEETCYDYLTIEPGEFYNFYVEDTPVTSLNCNDIEPDGLREGWISYNPEENTLTLNYVVFSANSSFLANNNDHLHMELNGINDISTDSECFWLLDDMYIEGSGSLMAYAGMYPAVSIVNPSVWLYLWDTDVRFQGIGGAIHGTPDCEQQGVQVVNSHVRMASRGNYSVVRSLSSFELENCSFVHDYFYFDESKGCICDERNYGDPVFVDEVEIMPAPATSISQANVTDDGVQHPSPAYNLQGQRVGDGYRGVVIKDGKKRIIK